MVCVRFLTNPDGVCQGFLMEGHAEQGEEGQDIVCAAISSAAYMAVNTLTEVVHVTPLSLRASEGEMYFRVEPKDVSLCRDVLLGLKLHLQGLEEQYPQALQVTYLEV